MDGGSKQAVKIRESVKGKKTLRGEEGKKVGLEVPAKGGERRDGRGRSESRRKRVPDRRGRKGKGASAKFRVYAREAK